VGAPSKVYKRFGPNPKPKLEIFTQTFQTSTQDILRSIFYRGGGQSPRFGLDFQPVNFEALCFRNKTTYLNYKK